VLGRQLLKDALRTGTGMPRSRRPQRQGRPLRLPDTALPCRNGAPSPAHCHRTCPATGLALRHRKVRREYQESYTRTGCLPPVITRPLMSGTRRPTLSPALRAHRLRAVAQNTHRGYRMTFRSFNATRRPEHWALTCLMRDLCARHWERSAGLAAQHLINEAGRNQLTDPAQPDEAR